MSLEEILAQRFCPRFKSYPHLLSYQAHLIIIFLHVQTRDLISETISSSLAVLVLRVFVERSLLGRRLKGLETGLALDTLRRLVRFQLALRLLLIVLGAIALLLSFGTVAHCDG